MLAIPKFAQCAAVAIAACLACSAEAQQDDAWTKKGAKNKQAALLGAIRNVDSPTFARDLSPHIAEGYGLRQFGSAEKRLAAEKDIPTALTPYRSAFPDLSIKPKRILSNKRLILVQSVTSGTNLGALDGRPATQRSVSAETMQIHWTSNGQIRSSEVFMAQEQMRLQSTRSEVPRAAAAPATPQVFTGPGAKVTKAIVGTIYGAASEAMASRIAWADGKAELAIPLLSEATASTLKKNDVDVLRGYLTRFGPSTVAIDNLFVSGPYVIAAFTFRGTHTGGLSGFTVGRKVEQEGYVVALIEAGAVKSTQTYFDQSLFQRSLRGQ